MFSDIFHEELSTQPKTSATWMQFFLFCSTRILSPNLSFSSLLTYNDPTDNTPDTCDGPSSNNILKYFHSGSLHLHKPRQPVNLGFFNVRILIQVNQQVLLVLTGGWYLLCQ